MSDLIQRDWRIGVKVQPKYYSHPLRGKLGTVVAVLPSGTAGLEDRNGLVVVRVDAESLYVLACADDWVTA